jgi:8-oxo-dGTP diphosphatase
MTEPNALTVTDIDGENARHAIGAHIVLVRDEGRILLGLRSGTVALAAGKWSTPCGNLDAGESLRQAAAREACEELGVIIDPADLKFATATHFVNDEGHGPALAVFFTTTSWSGTPQVMEPDKCDALGWYPLDELPEPIVPYVANALADVRAALRNGGVGCGFSEFGWGSVEAPPPGVQLPREQFVARHPRVLASAAMLITDAAGRVLLVDQSYRHDGLWNWPGGGADDDEPFHYTARREVAEELGLDIEPGPLLVVDRVPATDRPPMTVYLFDGGTLTDEQIAAITLADGEITDVGFFTPDEAAARLPDHGRRRLRNALAARAGALPSPDLEDGHARIPEAIPTSVENGAQ